MIEKVADMVCVCIGVVVMWMSVILFTIPYLMTSRLFEIFERRR
jgi:hypothetical protein